MDVVRGPALGQEVHRQDRKLQGGATLQEQRLVVLRYAHQFPEVGLRLGMDRHVFLAAVAHLHDGLAGAVPVEHFRRRFGEDFLRQDSGSRAEIEYVAHAFPNE
jgi:hypothetical protein